MLGEVWQTLRETVRAFNARGGRVLGAATAFYAMLSVAPMLLLAIAVTGMVTSEASARAEVVRDASIWVGPRGAELLRELLARLSDGGHGPFASVLGGALVLYASHRLFAQMRYSLNHIWGVQEESARGLSKKALKQARKRLAALTMVLLVVICVATTVLLKAGLHAASDWLALDLSGSWRALELGVSFLVLTALCAASFKVLPAVELGWRDVGVGALVTSVLFSAGAAAIGWYLGTKSTESTYGAAGSLVAVLLWSYYSAQVFFFGAAFTRVWAERHGAGIEPSEGAVWLVAEAPERARDQRP